MGDQSGMIDGILAVARRETFVLAAALQAGDNDATLRATARLRWALEHAEQFAARDLTAFECSHPRLKAVLDSAHCWFPTQLDTYLHEATLRRVFTDMLGPAPPRLQPIDASQALLVSFDLDDLPLAELVVRGARLIEVRAHRAQLDALVANTASIERCSFVAASLRTAGFEHAHLDGCDLSHANLERTRWTGAKVSRCAAAQAVLFDARFDDTIFIDCDFRGADFHSSLLTTAKTASNARFIRCDLRGTSWDGRNLGVASFFDCKLYGARGASDLTRTAIERPDLSPQGDGSEIGSKDEVAARWTARGIGPLGQADADGTATDARR